MKISMKKNLKKNKECQYCKCKFGDHYNDRCIILNEIVDKEKLLYIINNNDFNIEVNNLARNYYESLDNLGRRKFIINKNLNIKIDIMELEVVFLT